MAKMTKSERAVRLDHFLSNEANFVAVDYSDPRAVAKRKAAAALHHRKQGIAAAREVATRAVAASFEIGQSVHGVNNRRMVGEVVAINGSTISVNIGGSVRKFTAAMLVAA